MTTQTSDHPSAAVPANISNISDREKPSAEAFTVYADGSSLGNPGPAGWAVVITHPNGSRSHRSGALENATNNRAELTAAIEALLALPRGAQGAVRLDSEYVVRGVNNWRRKWEANSWKNSSGQGVANCELFKALFGMCDAFPLMRFEWVPGHAGDSLNELADRLARSEATKLREGVH